MGGEVDIKRCRAFLEKTAGGFIAPKSLASKIVEGIFSSIPSQLRSSLPFGSTPATWRATGSNWDDPPSSTVCSCLLFLGEGGSGLFGVCELWSGFLVPYLEMERKLESRLNIFQV